MVLYGEFFQPYSQYPVVLMKIQYILQVLKNFGSGKKSFTLKWLEKDSWQKKHFDKFQI